jgi:hypothetical protein
MAVYFFSFPAHAQYGGGTGEPNNPYLIYTAMQMNTIGLEPNDWDKHFKLMADIDLVGFTGRARLPLFNIIGYFISNDDNKPFTGVFDGNGKKISNFTYISKGVDNIGIFGYVNDPNAQIKNLGLINPNIDIDINTEAEIPVGSKYVGSLTGYFRSGTIINCYTRGGSVSGKGIVGRLVGENNSGTIANCYSIGNVSGTNNVGGLVGTNHGTIIDCYSTGSVSGIWTVGGLAGYNGINIIINSYSNTEVSGNQDVGGLVGLNRSLISNCYATAGVTGTGGGSIGGLVGRNHKTITDCYSTGSVSGFSVVGGLVGKNSRGTITNCYAVGSVICTPIDPVAVCQQGGLIGLNDVDTVYNSFWDIQTSGQLTSAGGTGKTTDEMQTENTFIGWWCGLFWTINEGIDYPRLSWENKPGKTISKQLSDFVAGSGEPNDPYLINTAEQLNMVGLFWCDWDNNFKLRADIDLSGYTGTDFNIIGSDSWSFTGVFDGNNHTISNFTYSSTGRDYVGLFGHVDGPAMIKDLGLVDPNVDAGDGTRVGSLVGRILNGTITNCYVDGGNVSSSSMRGYVGGLVGINGVEMSSDATITNCHATTSVMGKRNVGGLVGYNADTITSCYASGDVTGDNVVGGLAGDNSSFDEGGCIIANCYAAGNVSGQTQVGGLVGRNGSDFGDFGILPGTISNCYSVGSVSRAEGVGGLVGLHESGEVMFSFWDTQTSGQSTSAGGMGKTTIEMQMESTFTDAGWDFVDETSNGTEDIWWILEGQDYPRLRWERYGGGTGRPNDPYLIYTAEQMNVIGLYEQDWDKYFKLMADIDLGGYTGTEFNIIGYWVDLDSPDNRPFRGVFDGNGHTISNFTYTCTGKDHIGLFGYIEDHDAEIKNLGLIDPNIDAGTESWGISSLAGYLREGTITDCYVDGGSISGDEEVGGLLGCNWVGTIKNCYSTSIVSGNEDVGGLVGDNAGTITNCYSLGSVSGDEWVGGLVGWNWGTITNCYSTGHVEGTVDVGGLVGYGGGAIASFWDIETSGQPASAGGIGKTTAEMQTASTFVGWSFGDIWMINEGKDYPRLWWETEQGEEPDAQQLSDFLTGAGTEDNPYLIYTAEELNMIGLFPNEWDKHFKLMVDIDLAGITGTDFNIMGRGPDSAFSGVFDGNSRKISNFTYTSTEALNVGLFGYLKSTAVIKDLGLIDPDVYTGIYEMGGWGVGALVGLVGDGTIISCYVEGGNITGGWMVGLLIGYVEEGTVTDCYVEGGSVFGDEDVGGLVGFNQGTITNCYAISVVDCNSGGGLVGTHWAGEIINCYSAGSVTGNEWVGGLAGFNFGTITKCYSVSSVTANDILGGLVGDNWGDIMYSFWDVETSGQLTSSGGTGKTTAEMQTRSTFTNTGWDFVDETANGTKDIWWINEGQDYPRFWWELIPEN